MTQINQLTPVTGNTDVSHSVTQIEPVTGAGSFASTLRQQLQFKKNDSGLSASPSLGEANRSMGVKSANAAIVNTSQKSASTSSTSQRPAEKPVNDDNTLTQDSTESSESQVTANPVATVIDGLTGVTDDGKPDAEQSELSVTGMLVQSPDNAALMSAMPLSPWMQTMMAMRPDNGAATEENHALTTAASGQAGADAMFANTSDTAVASSANLADFSNTLNPLAADSNTEKADVVATDLGLFASTDETRQTLSIQDHLQSTLVASQLANHQPTAQVLTVQNLTESANILTGQITAPFANQERWQAAMNQQVVNMVGKGDDLASLTLSPPDLGPVQVVLKVDNQSVDTTFISDNPLVRQALEDGLQDLRERMQSQGLQLGQTFVGDGRQAQQHYDNQQSAAGAAQDGRDDTNPEAVADNVAPVARRVALGAVDTFA